MAPPAFPINPATGRVAVVDIKTGKLRHFHPVDVREQLACENPQIRLPEQEEVAEQVTPAVNFSQVPTERLREYAQDAGITFAGKSRAMIEAALTEQGYVPDLKDDDDD